MITVIHQACNRCGECINACPLGAIYLLNDEVFINQKLCEGCQACLDACSQDALVFYEIQPAPIKMDNTQPDTVEIVSPKDLSISSSNRSPAWSTISSLLLLTGQEVIPRLASLAMDYLEMRTRSKDTTSTFSTTSMQRGRNFRPGRGHRHRQRRGRFIRLRKSKRDVKNARR